jgi:hypothetical protein
MIDFSHRMNQRPGDWVAIESLLNDDSSISTIAVRPGFKRSENQSSVFSRACEKRFRRDARDDWLLKALCRTRRMESH